MERMKEFIRQLASQIIPSGYERNALPDLLRSLEDIADETHIDVLGNGIVKKAGHGPHVAISAHIDEPGVMVIHVEDNGYLRILSVGDLQPGRLIGRHVQFTGGSIGIVGVESEVRAENVTYDHLYVDLGCQTAAEANALTPIGTCGVALEPVVELEGDCLAGRALDNRAGCAAAIEAFRALAGDGRRVSLVLAAQSTVGARGAKTAAFALEPDVVFVIDAAPAGDMPKATRMELSLGQGPAIKILDGTIVIPLAMKDLLRKAADEMKINVQYEVWPNGKSDSGAYHLSQSGVLVGSISYPARYVGGISTVVNINDVQAVKDLVIAAAKAYQ
jgi:putative aminopeptidase FrvX